MTDSERTREILRKVRQVEIRSRKFVDESLVGAYHSAAKGSSAACLRLLTSSAAARTSR